MGVEPGNEDGYSEMYLAGVELAKTLLGDERGELAGIEFVDPEDDWHKEHVAWLFGYLLQDGPILPLRTKLLAGIAMATALRETSTIERWVGAAKRAGLPREEVQEAVLTTLIYGGLPGTRMAMEVIAAVWEEQ